MMYEDDNIWKDNTLREYKEHPDNHNEMNRDRDSDNGGSMFIYKDDPRVPIKDIGAKYDSGKLLFECFMGDLAPVIKGVVMVLTYGAKKYSRSSWQSVPNGKQRYLDAFYRHINAYHSGEVADEESGIAHLYHALCNLMFITWFEIKDSENT